MNAAPKTLRHLSDLQEAGLTSADKRAALEKVAAHYAVAITPEMAGLIDRADPHDPIARQFVPDAAELERRRRSAPTRSATTRTPGRRHRASLSRPRAAEAHARLPGLLPLLLPPRDGRPRPPRRCRAEALDAALAYIAAHPEIWEVILTGGDPLMLSPRRLGR